MSYIKEKQEDENMETQKKGEKTTNVLEENISFQLNMY